jgi:UDP-N-acetylmuramate dehydrogenase
LYAALIATGARVQENAPLHKLAYWRVGGCADYLVEAHSLETLQKVLALGPVTVLGNGSNTLIHDDGIRGVVLRLKGALAGLELRGTQATAGAGMLLTVLLSRLDKAGLAGAEPFVGVPGTVGGAVVMNAGTTLGEAQDLVDSVQLVLPGGELKCWTAQDLAFCYRQAQLPPGAVVATAELRLSKDNVQAQRQERQDLLARRKATQPLDLPSCGSTFTNPPGDYAGRLIEFVGLKGHRIGGASISAKHANFIVNHGNATAQDILDLIRMARQRVYTQTGKLMTPEVKLMGPWPKDSFSVDGA